MAAASAGASCAYGQPLGQTYSVAADARPTAISRSAATTKTNNPSLPAPRQTRKHRIACLLPLGTESWGVDGDAPAESLIPSRTPYNRRASRRHPRARTSASRSPCHHHAVNPCPANRARGTGCARAYHHDGQLAREGPERAKAL